MVYGAMLGKACRNYHFAANAALKLVHRNAKAYTTTASRQKFHRVISRLYMTALTIKDTTIKMLSSQGKMPAGLMKNKYLARLVISHTTSQSIKMANAADGIHTVGSTRSHQYFVIRYRALIVLATEAEMLVQHQQRLMASSSTTSC